MVNAEAEVGVIKRNCRAKANGGVDIGESGRFKHFYNPASTAVIEVAADDGVSAQNVCVLAENQSLIAAIAKRMVYFAEDNRAHGAKFAALGAIIGQLFVDNFVFITQAERLEMDCKDIDGTITNVGAEGFD